MTNGELLVQFDKICKLNYCDSIIELKKLKKVYKTTEFYKTTHISCEKAYKDFCAHKLIMTCGSVLNLLDTETIAEKISEIIDRVDPESVRKLSDSLMEGFGMTDLNQEKGELKVLLNKTKDIIE